MSDVVLTDRHDSMLVITINRPQARNAIDAAVTAGMVTALDELDADPALAVGILTGAGGTFSSGMDLKAFLRGEQVSAPGRGLGGLVRRPPAKPMIAAVEGYALAGGFELALACDLVVAAEDAIFGLPEVTRGIVAASGGLLRLPRRLPYHVAMELILTGYRLNAPDAHRHGLVNRLTAPGEALAQARELALRIAGNGPLAVRASKRIVVESADWPSARAFELQDRLVEPVERSADAREGALAFAEKRPPIWQAR